MAPQINKQITLPLRWPDNITFASFILGNNKNLVSCLQTISHGGGERFVYLWGQQGVGKSHLLIACSQQASAEGLQVFYLSLSQLEELSPQLIENLETFDLICIDDLQNIANNKLWEEAIFHLYNRSQNSKSRLIISGSVAVKDLSLQLPDLSSRLLSGIIFQVHELSDTEKLKVLQQRAQQCGLKLTQQVGEFLLRYLPRDLTSLINCLDQLDKASLASQRKLTIPFVKDIVKGSSLDKLHTPKEFK